MSDTTLTPLNRLVVKTASEHVCSRVPITTPEANSGEFRRSMQGQQYDNATHIAVCRDGKLVGVIRIESLLAASEDTPISSVMDSNPPFVTSHTNQEKAIWRALQHNETALSVVDAEGTFLGFITPQRLIAVLLWEHEEDMTRLGGYLRDTSSARAASLEDVTHRFLHRIPWLLLGLLGAVLAAEIVGSFEARLQATVTLAFFIPGIVYLADAVGTQTETLIVRGLSIGVGISHILRREVLTGFLIGLVLATAFFPMALLRWEDVNLAVSVSLSLFAACSTATLIALSLPWIFHRLGKDPAYGSGPLATVLQDLLSIVIYFAISSAIVS